LKEKVPAILAPQPCHESTCAARAAINEPLILAAPFRAQRDVADRVCPGAQRVLPVSPQAAFRCVCGAVAVQ
jgi:hypothetical protein